MDFNKRKRQYSSYKLNDYYKFPKTIFFLKQPPPLQPPHPQKIFNYFCFCISDVFCIYNSQSCQNKPIYMWCLSTSKFTFGVCWLWTLHSVLFFVPLLFLGLAVALDLCLTQFLCLTSAVYTHYKISMKQHFSFHHHN